MIRRLVVILALGSGAAIAAPVSPEPSLTAEGGSQSVDQFQIGVRADQRALQPVLAVRQEMTDSPDAIAFLARSNYWAFIRRAEIRLYQSDVGGVENSVRAIIPVDSEGRASGILPEADQDHLWYALRVYGPDGLWDETRLHALAKPSPDQQRNPFVESRLSDDAVHRAIPISGVTLTVMGRIDPRVQRAFVEGRSIPADAQGLFVSEQIVAEKTGRARIHILEGDRAVLMTERSYDASSDRWFVVGQGDITFSHSVANGPAVQVSGDPLAQGDKLSSRGAFYAKGTVGDDYRITASLDTGETLLKDLFSNIDRKDPTQLLRRVDERYQYPTFGDDSSVSEDAPSQGRFYLRAQKNDSNLVVGNFITAAKGTELVQLDRGLFGVMIDHKNQEMTRYGDRKRQVLAFASDPGTITASDELRGTGGSNYYLQHQDLSVGSERLHLEVRSPETGAVLVSSTLRVNEDYEIDYYQGRVTLLRPLASYLPNDELVRVGAASGNVPVLVARYEYTPPQGTIGGHSIGGRASQWFGDWLRIGVTGQSESSAPADQLVLGGDVMLKAGVGTWLKAEYGDTNGPGFAQSSSIDGGLNFTGLPAVARIGQHANAWRLEGALDEADLGQSARGKASGYYEDYQAGYAATGRPALQGMRRWGARLDQPLNTESRLALAYEGRNDAGVGDNVFLRGEWIRSLNAEWTLRTGVRFDDLHSLAAKPAVYGSRLDGALQATYARPGAGWSAYVFGQATVDRDATRQANDRGGLGMRWGLSSRLSAETEISDGLGGLAANASLIRRNSNGSEAHIGYRLLSETSDQGYDPQGLLTQASRGMLVVGGQQRVSDMVTMTLEERYGHGGTAPSLTHAYGLRVAPNKAWSFSSSVERGTIFDGPVAFGRLGTQRFAGTVSAGYAAESLTASSGVEYREDSRDGRSQSNWLFRNKVDMRLDEEWSLMARLEYAFSDTPGSSLQAAQYRRNVLGTAYRPVFNDRLNILGRYTYLSDLGPVGQIMTSGGIEQPKQVSRIVDIDGSYELSNWLTFGGKYAWRQGRVSLTRNSDVFLDSAATLYAVRADAHVGSNWGALVEERQLLTDRLHDSRRGFLAAVYRKLGNGLKLSVGYNFSDYSGDLTDQSYSTRGTFINLLSAF